MGAMDFQWIWNLDPVAFSILGLPVRWYGLVYVLGFLGSLYWIKQQFPQLKSNAFLPSTLKWEPFENFLFGLFFAGVVGGRLGIFLFYSPETLLADPLELFRVWNSGMSIHGGLIGSALYALWWCKKNSVSWLSLADILVLPLSLVLAFGRVANFINGELVGKPTDQTWGVVFPHIDELLRHPSQLYEVGKNIVIFLVLWAIWQKVKSKPKGLMLAVFLLGYGLLRFIIQFFREPTTFFLGWPVGQWLCAIMIVLGLGILYRVGKK